MKATAVALLAKAPVPGQVKTRFVPPYTYEQAAEYARAFLLDSVAVVNRFSAEVDLWVSYLGDLDILQSVLPNADGFLEQRGKRMDDRISNALADLRAQGYKNVIVVAADCPTIDAAYFEATLNGLENSDIVLGPANDGGCVLVGVGANGPDTFLDITMSTDTVFKEMLERADGRGATVQVLPVLHDIDTVEELFAANADGQLRHAENTQVLLHQSEVVQ